MEQRREKKPASSLDQFNRDEPAEQSFEALKRENSQLKDLVVRLSETVMRIVTGKK